LKLAVIVLCLKHNSQETYHLFMNTELNVSIKDTALFYSYIYVSRICSLGIIFQNYW